MSDIEFGGCTVHRGTLDDPCPWCEIERLWADLAEAERLIARAVELMTPDQVGQWEGVRAWQERTVGHE